MDINEMAQQMADMQRQINELRREVFCPSSDVEEIARLYSLGRKAEARKLMRKGKRQ